MITSTKQHLSNNKGDANVSKMTLIAIVFVVGAILLVLTTSAFRNPINRWFEKVTTGWFANENGAFSSNTYKLLQCERNANGTYQDVKYICMQEDGTYYVLEDVDTLSHGQTQNYRFTRYDADGNILNSNVYDRGPVQISSDGTTISAWDTFIAQPNN